MALAHEPIGKPGGPGVFGLKGKQYPAYFQHIRNDLIEQGHSVGKAHQLAWGILRNFAEGHDGHGGRVHPDTQAKAIAALAEMKKLQAEAKVTRSDHMSDGYDADGLDASWDGDLSDLPDLAGLDVPDFEALAGPEDPAVARAMPALGTGARYKALKAKLAAKGARNPGALAAYIGRKKFGRKKFTALAAKARKPAAAMSRSADWREITRPFMAEDLHIMRAAEGDSTGRVVEGYAAVFGQPQEIHDRQGDYREEIDPHAFDQALARMSQRRGGIGSAVRVLFNHGKTIEGHPAPEFQKPIGRAVSIVPDNRGLLTRTEFNRTALADEVLELIRSGSITGMSFQGNDLRSDPPLRGPGDRYRPGGGGILRTVRRMVLSLFEYSPVVFEAYPGAEFLGVVRMGSMNDLYGDGTATDGGSLTEAGEAAAEEDGGATGSTPEAVHPTRDHAHRLLVTRMEEMCQRSGLVLPGRG